MSAKYVVGIDLGTTNCVLAYASLDEDKPKVEVLQVPQLVAEATVECRSSLASFLYVAGEHETSDNTFHLPWSKKQKFAVGEYARRYAADAPDRTVAAAKSWLCHSQVDRRQAILPWNAPPETDKVSPVVASRRYLEHLVATWKHAFPKTPLAKQQVILTVPASFDAVARELTREAASEAGLPEDLVLLEEPQAAVYAWLVDVGERWRTLLKVGDRLLVCDIGGGTTDLTLIQVAEEAGDLVLERVAVGDHLLVGGDNMDLALAHHVGERFKKKKVKLNPWQSVSLWHSCRMAKESLLSSDGTKKQSISVLGRGSKLIGGTVSVEVDRKQVTDLLVDGFLPQCKLTDQPTKQHASGFQQLGLPFESDSAISRHVAAFLSAHADSTKNKPIKPTHVLLNGGVFKAEVLRSRFLGVLEKWCNKKPPKLLGGSHNLDHAVAIGAAYYGWTKQQGGMRIRGGTARAYYVGIETSAPAIPGAPRPLQALCVVPFGMEEGTEIKVPSNDIGLLLGEPAQFRFFSSPVRKQDSPGDLLQDWDENELVESDSLETELPSDDAIDEPYVPVQFESRVTELGMFELWCVSTKTKARWKLEFSVRDNAEV